ncbi:PTS fructose transporter subunit EIIBC [Acetobacteraceae bacterium H6797]|nr:PTS fructose transporter subunit EIIBC [Acetobacteraceae bacterium H6797]
MFRVTALIRHKASPPHAEMAAQALAEAAPRAGVALVLDTEASPAPASAEGVLLLLGNEAAEAAAWHPGRPVLAASLPEAIRHPEQVLAQAKAIAGIAVPAGASPAPVPAAAPSTGAGKKLVGITACPTGIAHTFMAAAALEKGAASLGHTIRVETQGSVGAQSALTPQEIAEADAVVIAADTGVDTSRFGGKRMIVARTGDALKDAPGLINKALSAPIEEAKPEAATAPAKAAQGGQAGPYRHLMTGVSYMIPLVTAGGLAIALSFAFGIEAFKVPGSLAEALMTIGGKSAFALMVPVLAAFIAFSIADRPGLAPGFIGGMIANNIGAGFLGGIVAGFLAGYVARFIRDKVPLPASMQGLKPVLVIPLLASLIVGLMMIYVLGTPIAALLGALTRFLQGMGTTNAVLLGIVAGGMMAVDMGGPVNKAAYAFGVSLLSTEVYAPMAAIMAAGMTPPLGIALAALIARNKFTPEEREASKAAAVLGLSFITEGAIPFAAKDPLRVIPSFVLGSAVAGGLSMLLGCTLRAPHGGIFVVGIPSAVGNPIGYIAAIVAGTVVTALALAVVKRRLA